MRVKQKIVWLLLGLQEVLLKVAHGLERLIDQLQSEIEKDLDRW